MIAEKFLDIQTDNIKDEIIKFKKDVLNSLKDKGINDCTILTKEQNGKIHVVAISCISKENIQDNEYEKEGFKFIKNDIFNNKEPSIEPKSISFDFKKTK
jgi:hypothetical protein